MTAGDSTKKKSAASRFKLTQAKIRDLPTPEKRTRHYDTVERHLVCYVQPSGSKQFYLYRKFKGRIEQIKLGVWPDMSVAEARKAAREENTKIDHGESEAQKRRNERKAGTFGELFAEYLEYSKLHRRESTWKEYERQFNASLGKLAKQKLTRISKRQLIALHTKMGRGGHPYAANRLISLISGVFTFAIDTLDLDLKNPAQGIRRFKEQERDRWLEGEELLRFVQAAVDEHNIDARDYCLLSLFTGARQDNVVSMRWSHIKDLGAPEARLELLDTKSGKPYTVPLLDEAVEILQERYAKRDKTSDYVFSSSCSNRGYMRPPVRAFGRIRKRAGIDNLRPHDLRRTFGSFQAGTNSSLHIIGRSLGHTSSSSTKIYARLDLDPIRTSMRNAVDAMGLKKAAKD